MKFAINLKTIEIPTIWANIAFILHNYYAALHSVEKSQNKQIALVKKSLLYFFTKYGPGIDIVSSPESHCNFYIY